ncbi:MAG: glycine cleavage T C-terminal barrel domain-containing protein [Saprospiraceae bacterium]
MKAREFKTYDYPILDDKGNNIGNVTSGSQSPSLDIPIGMGYS